MACTYKYGQNPKWLTSSSAALFNQDITTSVWEVLVSNDFSPLANCETLQFTVNWTSIPWYVFDLTLNPHVLTIPLLLRTVAHLWFGWKHLRTEDREMMKTEEMMARLTREWTTACSLCKTYFQSLGTYFRNCERFSRDLLQEIGPEAERVLKRFLSCLM